MSPDGVAVFYRNPLSGEDQPVEFVWGTDATSIRRAWEEAVEKLSAEDAEELRRDGYYARLVSLEPLMEDDLGLGGFIQSSLRCIEISVTPAESTSNSGNEKVTQNFAEATLKSNTVRVPLEPHEPALPEFTADYLDCRDEGDIEMALHFVLKDRTSSHAIYFVQECDSQHLLIRGKMAKSNSKLRPFRRVRRPG